MLVRVAESVIVNLAGSIVQYVWLRLLPAVASMERLSFVADALSGKESTKAEPTTLGLSTDHETLAQFMLKCPQCETPVIVTGPLYSFAELSSGRVEHYSDVVHLVHSVKLHWTKLESKG